MDLVARDKTAGGNAGDVGTASARVIPSGHGGEGWLAVQLGLTIGRDGIATVSILQEGGIGNSSEGTAVDADAELAAIPTGAVELEAVFVDKLEGYGAALGDSEDGAGELRGVWMTVLGALAIFKPDAGCAIVHPRSFHRERRFDSEATVARVEILIDESV